MCIIAISPKNTAIPSKDRREEMFASNPDGAGFMYPYRGRVRIEKGFMKFSEMEARIEELGKTLDLTATPIVFHYRIGTHGGNVPQNTHPFPVTSNRHSLRQLQIDSWLGVVHNGIIHTVKPRKGYSDTQEYIAQRIARFRHNFIHSQKKLDLIETETFSKLAFLTPDGEIVTVGKFIHDADGCLYSNDSYNIYRFSSYSLWGSYYGKNYKSYKKSKKQDKKFDDSDGWSASMARNFLYSDCPPFDYDSDTYEAEVEDLSDCCIIDGDGDLHDGSEYCCDQYGRIYRYNADGTATIDSRARIMSYSGSARNPYADWAYDEYEGKYDPDDWETITCIGKTEGDV